MKRSFSIAIFLFLSSLNFALTQTDSIFAERNFLIFNDKVEITIIIHKPNQRGFARIYERLPEGTTVTHVESVNAYYKSEKTMLKIAWDDIASDTIVAVTYTIQLNHALIDTLSAFEGTFSAEFMPAEKETIKISNHLKKYQKENLVVQKNEIIKETLPKKEEKKTIESKIEVTKDNSTYICIQVAAVGENVASDYLMKKFNYSGEFESHFEGKFYRITVGKFSTIKEAQEVMNELKSKYFQKCFLSAYSNGVKIPVYEAEKLLK